MDNSTANTLVGGIMAFMTACGIFVLGLIVAYVRSISRGMKELLEKAIRSETRVELMEKQIEDIYKRLNNKGNG